METTLINPERTRFTDLTKLIGRTPMVRIGYRFKGGPVQHVYAKCEQFNLTGSIKDRMALHILQKATDSNELEPGDTIAEATSGNTGISLAAIGRALGHRVKIFMPDWLSGERKELIKSFGAELELVGAGQGGFRGAIRLAEAFAKSENGVFLPRQFSNQFNVEAHVQGTGQEIISQLSMLRVPPKAFVAGVGTGGTIMGVGQVLRKEGISIHPLEPSESPTLSTGQKSGSHRIQGISDEFVPDILDLSKLDSIVRVNDGDAILAAQLLAGKLGLAVGISSGANLLGAIKIQQRFKIPGSVVTIFPDSSKKYVSTALFREEPVLPGYLTPLIELVNYQTV